jgi:Flp pilus assembly protein TadB
MGVQFQIAALLIAVAVFFWIIFIFALWHKNKTEHTRPDQPHINPWLFDNWCVNIYNSLFTSEPETFARRLGVNVDRYIQNCTITRQPVQLKAVVVKKLLGFLLAAVCGIAGVILGNILMIPLGLLAAFPLIYSEVQKADKAAKVKKFHMVGELPRFIDLLQTALQINMPVEDAIILTAKNLNDTVLSGEFLTAVADMQLGVHDWQAALEKLARNYEIDALSDFVLDLVTSYNKGVPIADIVARKSRDIKQNNLLSMKERASKLTSTILLPVLGFKVLPLLALLCIPIIQQISRGL